MITEDDFFKDKTSHDAQSLQYQMRNANKKIRVPPTHDLYEDILKMYNDEDGFDVRLPRTQMFWRYRNKDPQLRAWEQIRNYQVEFEDNRLSLVLIDEGEVYVGNEPYSTDRQTLLSENVLSVRKVSLKTLKGLDGLQDEQVTARNSGEGIWWKNF